MAKTKKNKTTKMNPDDLIYELRGGNHVKCKVSNDAATYQVIIIDIWNHKVMLSGVRQGEWHSIKKIKPLKLSKEWFDKQVKAKPNSRYYIYDDVDNECYTIGMPNGLFMTIDKDGYGVRIGQTTEFSHELIKLQYVHELQNIYIDINKESLQLI